MKAARWTSEQLAEHLQKSERQQVMPVASGNGRAATSGLKLSNDRLEGIAEYLFQIQAAGIDVPEFEYRFHPTRRWLADFAWPDRSVLAEYEGGVFTNGAHVRGKHYESDCEKYSEAAILGFRVIRFTHRMVSSGKALDMTARALAVSQSSG